MCKKISFFLSFLLFFCLLSPFAYATDVSAKGAILIEADSGEIIYEKNIDQKMPMASTTKIMTAILIIEGGNLDKPIKITNDAVGVEGSSIYLKEGEIFTKKELLYALLLESANDSAVALALDFAGGVDEFTILMNKKANELALVSTHFENPHGLDGDEHYTTPKDLAYLTKYAMSNPIFCEIVSTKKATIGKGEGKRYLVNHNKLLRLYEGTNGVKTGFTKKSGRCLVSSCERDGVKLICVSLNAPSDWNDHQKLYDMGFSKYESVLLANTYDYLLKFEISGGESPFIYATNPSSLSITLPKDAQSISAKVIKEENLSAKIKEGDEVGSIIFYNYDKEIASLPLVSVGTVNKLSKKSFFRGLLK